MSWFSSKDVAIYRLVDPRTGETRYIGSTKSPRQRLSSHVSSASGGFQKILWIDNMKAAGVSPRMKILEWTTEKARMKRERHWIHVYARRSQPLTNGNMLPAGWVPPPSALEYGNYTTTDVAVGCLATSVSLVVVSLALLGLLYWVDSKFDGFADVSEPRSTNVAIVAPTSTNTPIRIATRPPRPTSTNTPIRINTRPPRPTPTETPFRIATRPPRPTPTRSPTTAPLDYSEYQETEIDVFVRLADLLLVIDAAETMDDLAAAIDNQCYQSRLMVEGFSGRVTPEFMDLLKLHAAEACQMEARFPAPPEFAGVQEIGISMGEYIETRIESASE